MKYLYLMRTPSMPFRTKIGITKYDPSEGLRSGYIARSIKAEVIVVFYVRLRWAYFWEQSLHKLFWLLKAKAEGSGKGEWFWFVRLICFLLYPTIWLIEFLLVIVAVVAIAAAIVAGIYLAVKLA